MEPTKKKLVEEPFTGYGRYSYADYLTWEIDQMVELIKGKVFRSVAAAPRMKHQQIVLRLGSAFLQYLENKPCEAFIAPFDVRLPVKSMKIFLRLFSQIFVWFETAQR
jgi:hypothetical protein